MNSTLLLIFSTLMFYFCSCNENRNMTNSSSVVNNAKEHEVNNDLPVIDVISITSQIVRPGVESNLKGINTYEVSLRGKVTAPFVIQGLLVDSIRIPIQKLNIDGKSMDSETPISASFEKLSFRVSRYLYGMPASNPKNPIEEVKYELSGIIVPRKNALLEYKLGDEVFHFPLGEVTKKESVYRP